MKKIIVLLALAASVAGFAAEGVRTVAEKPRKIVSLHIAVIDNKHFDAQYFHPLPHRTYSFSSHYP